MREGSSPLTRGKRTRVSIPHQGGRLIPAHAGKTSPRPTARCPRRAHPRSRGENRGAGGGDKVGAGSSPLTRGKQSREANALKLGGLIPAHAGKTHPPPGCPQRSRAHPRSRGENDKYGLKDNPELGSSPLTRGKLVGLAVLGCPVGLIPAHAGKTQAWPIRAVRLRAHPRSRGENTS